MMVPPTILNVSKQRAEEVVAHVRPTDLKIVSYVVPAGVVIALAKQCMVPSRILLGSLADRRLQVHIPLPVKLSTEGGHVIAEAEELDEFGFGTNPSEAIRDLQRALAELYFTLEQEQHRLGPDLQRVWGRLQSAIRHRT